MTRRMILLVFFSFLFFFSVVSNATAGECTADDKFQTIRNKNLQGQTSVIIRVFDERTGKLVPFPVIELGRPYSTRMGGYDCWICSDDPPAYSWKAAAFSIRENPRDGTLVYKVPHDSAGNIDSWLISQSDPTKICIRVHKPNCNYFYEGSATVHKGYDNYFKLTLDCSGVVKSPEPAPLPPPRKPPKQPKTSGIPSPAPEASPPPSESGPIAKEWLDEVGAFWIFRIGMPAEAVLQLTDKNEKGLWKQRNINPPDGEKNPRDINHIGLSNFKLMEKDWFLNFSFKDGRLSEINLENATPCYPNCSTSGQRAYHQILVQKISEKYGPPTFRDSKMNDLGKDPNWGRTVDYHLREVWQAKNKDGKNYEGELTSVYRCNNCDGPMNTNNQYITQISFRETAPQKSTSSSNLGMLFYDHFDDKVYLDKWTVLNQTPLTTITESGSDLHLYSKKPSGKDPQNAILMAKPFFSSHAFAVETRIKPLGRGGMWMMIFKDWNNYLRFGFSTDDTPYIEIDGMRNGKWFAESKCCSHALFNASYHTFTIKKSGSQYQVFIDGNAWGRYVHDSIGDSNLRIGLWSETFEWKSRDADNYIDYVKVEE